MRKLLSIIIAANGFVCAYAQMDNVVEVESTYKPTVNEAKKIDARPQAETTSIKHYDVKYSLDPIPTTDYEFEPTFAALSDAAVEGESKGFFTLAGGNFNNMLARGTYGFDLSKDNSLDFDLGLRGHIGDVDIYNNKNKTWRQRFFSTKGMIKFEHRLSPLSSIIIRADGENQVYNHQHERGSGDYDKQHNKIGSIDFTVTPFTTGIFTVGGFARYKMFTRRCLLTPSRWTSDLETFNPTENRWELGLTTDLSINDQNKLGVDLQYQNIGWSEGDYMSLSAFDVIPHFTIDNDKTYIRLGARLTFDKGTELQYEVGEYHAKNKFKVAPDVYMAFHINPNIDIFGEATGGVIMNDFWQMQSMTPYWKMPYFQLASSYNNISAKAGFKWKIIEGLFTKIYAGYDDMKNRAELTLPVYDFAKPETSLYQNDVFTADGSLIHFNLEADYKYKDLVKVGMKGRFNGWDIDDNNGYYESYPAWRPTVEAEANVCFQPVEGLNIGIDYQFAVFPEDDILNYKRPTTSNLGASISYRIPVKKIPNLTIYAKTDNLLGQKYDWYYGHKAIGTSVLAGFAVNF